jgi:pyruvate/2-oxoglutarate dehydrogenase complex dihydrolipoamide acyltransferase (E2) component
MTPIRMPQVGHNIPTATIVEWKKAVGEPVEKGEVVLVVESDKSAFDVEAEESGILLEILHREGEEVEVFKPLGYLGSGGETRSSSSPGAHKASSVDGMQEAAPAESPPARPPAGASSPSPPGGLLASPAARRLARERGVDLASVRGTGPGGRITAQDVERAAGTPEGEA